MVVLKNDSLKISLRLLGAKITSLCFLNKQKAAEFLYQPTNKEFYSVEPKPGDTFDQKMAWGADICVPSVARCELKPPSRWNSFEPGNSYTMRVGDHGDFWTTEFQVAKKNNNRVTLVGKTKEFQLIVTFLLQGSTLIRGYRITNLTKYTLPFTFADHFLVPIQKVLISKKTKMKVEWSYKNKLGQKNDQIVWSVKRTKPLADKLFYKAAKASTETLIFSSPELKYVGYWETQGGWNNQYNLGMELTNTNCDSLEEACKTNKVWRLKPGKSKKWTILLSLRGA